MRQLVILGELDREDGGYLGVTTFTVPIDADREEYVKRIILNRGTVLQNIIDNFGCDLVCETMEDLDIERELGEDFPAIDVSNLSDVYFENGKLNVSFVLDFSEYDEGCVVMTAELDYDFVDFVELDQI